MPTISELSVQNGYMGDLDLFNNPVVPKICDYRHCEEMLTQAQINRHGRFHSDRCRRAEHHLVQGDIKAARAFEWDDKFDDWIRKNFHFYELAVKLTFVKKNAGFKRYGIRTICEIIRWEHYCPTTGDEYKVNNNFFPRTARKIIAEYPEFEGFFVLREKNNERQDIKTD